MSTQHHSLVTVVADGLPLGVFETRTGGESTAEVTKYRPGGMAKQKTRKGLPEVGDVTVGRSWERERDAEIERRLRPRVGTADIIVNDQPLDDNGAPWGKPTTWTGTLNAVNGGDSDSNSNDGKMFELVVVAVEVV